LTDFRCYEQVELGLDAGATVITGRNGHGKTSLLEAVAWLAGGRSIRGVPDKALVRSGQATAIIRAEVHHPDRTSLIEVAIQTVGRNRILVNKQSVTRRRDLAEQLRVTVFAPDDLALVKGGPAGRRDLLDDLLVATAPRFSAIITDYERVVKQRNALLRAGIRDADDRRTRDVLDARLVETGSALIGGRLDTIAKLTPEIERAYVSLAGSAPGLVTQYEPEWHDGELARDAIGEALTDALTRVRKREEDRGLTLVGPHRDDWALTLHELDARHHASQGEQRTLALGLRLAGHRLVAETTGAEPVLLLDDVFSELDAQRATALVEHLPATQTLITTAGALPDGIRADAWIEIENGKVVA
jgi:DNA replication and repair protein RecF